MALSSLVFCTAMHPELVALDAELSAVGGCARAIMDDVYAVGPASVVYAAIERVAEAIEEMTGMQMVQHKLGCYSHDTQALLTCPWRIRSQTPVGTYTGADETVHYGITVGNVPIGTAGFVQAKLRAKANEVVQYVASTVQLLNTNSIRASRRRSGQRFIIAASPGLTTGCVTVTPPRPRRSLRL